MRAGEIFTKIKIEYKRAGEVGGVKLKGYLLKRGGRVQSFAFFVFLFF